MSTTLNRQHAALLDRTAQMAVEDLVALWRRLDHSDADRLVSVLLEAVPSIAARWSDVSAVGASDFFDAVRAYYNAGGSFAASPATPAPPEQVQATTRWAVDPLFQASPNDAAALERLSAGLDRLVRQADRDTIAGNATRDPRSSGWRRVARPGACAFCIMLAGRDDYTSQAAASEVGGGARRSRGPQSQGSRYHDHCRCFPVPVYRGYEPGPQELAWQELYAQASVPGSTRQTLANMRRLLAA